MRGEVSNGRQWTTTGPRGPTGRRPRPRRRSPRRAGPRRGPSEIPPTSIRRSPRAESMSATYNAWQQPPQSARNPMPSVTIRGGFLRQQKTNEQNDRVLLHFVKPFTLFPWHRVWHFRPRSFFRGITPTTAPGAGRRGRRPLPRPTPHTHGRARRPRRGAPTGTPTGTRAVRASAVLHTEGPVSAPRAEGGAGTSRARPSSNGDRPRHLPNGSPNGNSPITAHGTSSRCGESSRPAP